MRWVLANRKIASFVETSRMYSSRTKSILTALFILVMLAPDSTVAATSVTENIPNVVSVYCGYVEEDEYVTYSQGSGIVVQDGVILTNAHVVNYEDEDGELYLYDWCLAGFAEDGFLEPEFEIILGYGEFTFADAFPVASWEYNEYFDYEFMFAVDEYANYYDFDSQVRFGNSDGLQSGDVITILGYPDVGGSTVTSTIGSVSGFNGTNWIKSDAQVEFGNSGGGVFDDHGNLIGIATAVTAGEVNSLSNILSINSIFEMAFSAFRVMRDVEHLFTDENQVCFYTGGCFQGSQGYYLDTDQALLKATSVSDDSSISQTKRSLLAHDSVQLDENLVDRLRGYILLQTESVGEAWYLNPSDGYRYYMADGETAYEMMRSFGLGITDVDLEQIPKATTSSELLASDDVCQSNKLANRTKGKILLQVEQRGEAWFVHPENCTRIYMTDGAAAYEIMRYLSLGITNADLVKIPDKDFETVD